MTSLVSKDLLRLTVQGLITSPLSPPYTAAVLPAEIVGMGQSIPGPSCPKCSFISYSLKGVRGAGGRAGIGERVQLTPYPGSLLLPADVTTYIASFL